MFRYGVLRSRYGDAETESWGVGGACETDRGAAERVALTLQHA